MNESAVIDFAALQALTGYSQVAAVERCLKRQGVPVMHGKDGVFTTLSAIENGLGIRIAPGVELDKHDFGFE